MSGKTDSLLELTSTDGTLTNSKKPQFFCFSLELDLWFDRLPCSTRITFLFNLER